MPKEKEKGTMDFEEAVGDAEVEDTPLEQEDEEKTDDELEDELDEDETEELEDDLTSLDRAALKAKIKEDTLDIPVYKKDSDDEIREKIREASVEEETLSPTEERAAQFRMADILSDTQEPTTQTIKVPKIVEEAKLEPSEFFTEDIMQKLVSEDGKIQRETLNAALHSAANFAFKQALKAFPGVFAALRQEERENYKEALAFYENNKELSPFKDIVGKVVTKLKAASPDKSSKEILEEAGEKTRDLLRLKKEVSGKPPGGKKPTRPPGTGGRKGGKKPALTKLQEMQKQIQDNLG